MSALGAEDRTHNAKGGTAVIGQDCNSQALPLLGLLAMPRRKLQIQLVGECNMAALPDPVWPDGIGEIYLPWLENWSVLKSEVKNGRDQEMALVLASMRFSHTDLDADDNGSIVSQMTARDHVPTRPASPSLQRHTPPPRRGQGPRRDRRGSGPRPRAARSPVPATPPRRPRSPLQSRSPSPKRRRSSTTSRKRSPSPRRHRTRSKSRNRSVTPPALASPGHPRSRSASDRRTQKKAEVEIGDRRNPTRSRSRSRTKTSSRERERRRENRRRERGGRHSDEDTDAEEDRLQYQADVLSTACPQGTIPPDFADLPLVRRRKIVARGRDRLTHARSLSVYRLVLCAVLVGIDLVLTKVAKVPKGLVEYHSPFMHQYTSLLVDLDKQTGSAAGKVPPLIFLTGLVLFNTCVYAMLSAFCPWALPGAQDLVLRMTPDQVPPPPVPASAEKRQSGAVPFHRF